MQIKIPGTPIALKRHRSFLRNGQIFHYDPQTREKKVFIGLIKYCIGFYKIKEESYYKVQIDFKFPYPLSKKTKKTPDITTIPHTTKPDIDNLVKFVLDCGNGVLWPDDKKIIALFCTKSYDLEPSTTITVQEYT